MLLLFYFFAAIAIWLGVLSLRGGVRYYAHVRRETARQLREYTPFASVIAPFRGLDQGLTENIHALFKQDYPAYEIIFVTDRPDDLALKVVEEVRVSIDEGTGITSRVVIAGDAVDSGQKVHNLRAAAAEIDPASEVLVFVDTDARPHVNWLRSLVAPLRDEQLGAATGYRWFIPVSGGLAAHLRSVWNASIASALGAHADKNFCWGGSTAIRHTTFERLKVADRWRATVSDDFTLTRVLQEAKLPIHFVPDCLTVSFDDCSFRELLEFTTRQLKITRVYAAHLWKAVLLGSLFFVLVFFGGLALVIARVALGLSVVVPLTLLAIIFVLGAAKAWIRVRAVRIALANHGSHLRGSLMAHLLLWPFASALFLYNALAAAFSRRINWRGISYELKSPTEAVIISREQ
jgi:cellulose synthase/poly-beta-1,6-N-acetylglucosamine synthase-like glycosyltransferase